MKRTFKFLAHLVPLFVLAIITSGCGSDSSKAANSSSAPESTPAPSAAVSPTPKPNEEPEDDIWTYYDNAKWEDDFEGLLSEIKWVAASDKIPEDDKNGYKSAVGVKFKVKNNTDGKFSIYIGHARLVTSTGEQIDIPSASEIRDGEIDKGVTKEGVTVWELEKSKVSDIDWVKLQWYVFHSPDTKFSIEDRKIYEVELKLK
ncbi:hypothetical protein B7C51_06755 [Paenibacillus larvae subsp. pulvifaciens]|uniref:Lipoprotein n=1 Tax=Paenibacillus larvae subsp. pulvifaciens TaxID=1477 RepID=A0A1V0UR46_9BACL|nr:hypothetical protein [Paenibacillus larvae]ARF67587.1 hypothetical protein B7C51_06755 [Paenibacillus larvae subsp. pulvifaciens]